MEQSVSILSLPAVIALCFKVILLLYASRSPVHNHHTRIFLYLLFALSLLNLAEIFFFHKGQNGSIPIVPLYVYFLAAIPALVLFIHLYSSLTIGLNKTPTKFLVAALYVYGGILEALLLFTNLLISGFVPVGYSYYRIPGPLYPLFEIYAIGCFTGVIGLLIYGSFKQSTSQKRIKCQLMLIGMAPMIMLVVTNIVLMHIGITWLNTPITLPIVITFFLVIATYAIHQYRIFDIQFYIPWSNVRKRKTVFYERIRALVAEIADLGTVNQAIGRLAETLRCPVALVGGNRSVLAFTGGGARMTEFPKDGLRGIDRITEANEIADSMPDTHALMRQYGIAAIVPFYPHSRAAASWMLLGESFSEQVYTPLDFKMVEQLFDKMAELFLDRMIHLRTQLADAQRDMRILEQRLHKTEENLMAVKDENSGLREQNSRLLTDNLSSLQTLVLGPSAAASEQASAPDAEPQSQPETKTLEEYVSEFEAQIIKQTLERCNGNKSKAARILGLRPNTLHYKLERYGLVVEKKKTA